MTAAATDGTRGGEMGGERAVGDGGGVWDFLTLGCHRSGREGDWSGRRGLGVYFSVERYEIYRMASFLKIKRTMEGIPLQGTREAGKSASRAAFALVR